MIAKYNTLPPRSIQKQKRKNPSQLAVLVIRISTNYQSSYQEALRVVIVSWFFFSFWWGSIYKSHVPVTTLFQNAVAQTRAIETLGYFHHLASSSL